MKIVGSVREKYDDSLETYKRLKADVDEKVRQLIEPRWHYESRLKTLESFAQKIETGRCGDASKLEDFFACTIVVSNLTEVPNAEQLIESTFKVGLKRPGSTEETSKQAYSFVFDDLRLYATLRENPALPPKAWEQIIFEVQVKTFLQHAWTIATHDVTYKTDNPNWAKERITFQIKAMLEHAELSIGEIENLSKSGALAKENKEMKGVRMGADVLRKHFDSDLLPTDILRLSGNIIRLFAKLHFEIALLNDLLEDEKSRLGNSLPLNLSPFLIVVQALLYKYPDRVVKYLKKPGQNYKILIPEEIEIPAAMNRTEWRNAITI